MVVVWWREPRLGWVLVPAPLLFLAFMGPQGRYFGRWLLPVFPIACLLAALAVVWAVDALAGRRRALARRVRRGARRRPARAGPDPHRPLRAHARARRHAQPDARVDARARPARCARRRRAGLAGRVGARRRGPRRALPLVQVPVAGARVDTHGALTTAAAAVRVENYETTLAPALLGYYERTATAGW